MKLSEVHPFPETGQWWACKNPLILCLVTSPGSVLLLKAWDPLEGVTDMNYLMPLDEKWTYLWFHRALSLNTYFRHWNPLRVGDAFYNAANQVFFVGSIDRKTDTVMILSDELIHIPPDVYLARLQQGPADPSENPPSTYDRLLREDSIDEESVPKGRESARPIVGLEVID